MEANFGLPLTEEVLWSPEDRKPLATLVEARHQVQHLEGVVSRGTTPDGVFGARLMWPHFEATLTAIRSLPPWESRSETELVEHLFPAPHFVLLTREDKVRQGISLYRAQVSKRLNLKEDGPDREIVPVPYDRDRIATAIRRLQASDEGWRTFFRRNEIDHTEILYEEICDDLRSGVNRILELLGRQPCPADLPLIQRFRIMRDQTTDEWAARFARSCA